MAGVSGTNLYVVIDGEVTFVPLSDVRGKTKEGMKEVIAAYVLSGAEIGGLAELEGSGFDLLNEGNLAYEIGQIADEAAREAAEAAFQEVVESAGRDHDRVDRTGHGINAYQHDILRRRLYRRHILLILRG